MVMDNQRKILMNKYEVEKLLGQGNFAKVYRAKNVETGQIVAIKVIEKERVLKVGLIEQTKTEIAAMKTANHPNVIELYEVMATKSKIYIVMEYARGGELFTRVARGKLKEDTARKYFRQLISAVDYCHSRGVFHRDLKPENLLLDENGDLKVSDFGLSALVECRGRDVLLRTTCGTPAYVAPDVVRGKGYDGARADIWSCGVILFVLLAGFLPWNDANLVDMYKKIAKGEYVSPQWFSPEAARLVSRMLNPNPSKRISIPRITESSWFRRGHKRSRDEAQEATSSGNDAQELATATKHTKLNAFDIISLSTGFDLSGLFAGFDERRKFQFTSNKAASSIAVKLEEIARSLRLKVKRERGCLRMEGAREGRKGVMSIEAEIHEFTPTFHLVEVKKSSGDTLEYKRVMENDIRPALKDIVWAWHGQDKHLQPL